MQPSAEIFVKEPEEKSIGFPGRLVENLQDAINEMLKRNEGTLKTCRYVILNVALVSYFALATYYFIEFSNDTLESTTCTGYGFLMIIFILVYFGVAYSLIIKPIINRIDTGRISNLLSNRAVTIATPLAIAVAIGVYLAIDTSDNRQRLVPLLGLFVFLLFGFLFSKHPRQIKWRPVVWGLILQFVLGLLTIRWDVGRGIFECLGNKTATFMGYAAPGSAFVYGDFLIYQEAVFFFRALSTVFFLAYLINVLYHYGIMQKIVGSLGELLQAVMGTTICESVISVANIFLSMIDSPLILKPYLEELTVSEIHAMMTSGFASIAGTLLAAYMSAGAEASHLITASVISAPAALCYSKLVYPETEEVTATKETIQLLKTEYTSPFDAACNGTATAVELVLRTAANLIAFISAIQLTNGLLSWMGILLGFHGDNAWTLETTASYVFMPVMFILGVPWDECQSVARMIGIKTMANEFLAFREMGRVTLRKRTKVIATYAICGFSNPGAIGVTISTLSLLMPKKKSAITSTVFRAVVAGEISSFMTACIAALLIPDHLL
ncbi:hypothetical protein PPYR_03511 [Photinus pyralis]|uniref:Sodium/nucleoside cotransporter n=1 Tax=Photinus pyralis TaxID=7054 RepID=A0A5N4A332_PHOPY|nr:solute carrier family 28 member 3-like [Photinus pyralis]XP_031331162.1 solute carrier family 28 member 3-like [Photinus pyralis]KAB0791711.1 hypothetical protein PPYR_03511 [Photinus pyralis]